MNGAEGARVRARRITGWGALLAATAAMVAISNAERRAVVEREIAALQGRDEETAEASPARAEEAAERNEERGGRDAARTRGGGETKADEAHGRKDAAEKVRK